MDFEARTDIEAPIAWVFQQVTDFAAFERQAMRRGADVRRRDTLERPGVGASWAVQFRFRGKDRKLNAEIVTFDPPNGYGVDMTSSNLNAEMRIELVALSRSRTRLTVRLAVEARSLSARLLMQSLRLAKGKMNRSLDEKVTGYGLELQERYARRPGANPAARQGA